MIIVGILWGLSSIHSNHHRLTCWLQEAQQPAEVERLSLIAIGIMAKRQLDDGSASLGAGGLPAFVVQDDTTFDLSHFIVPEHYAADLSSVMIPHGFIMDRVEKLAVDICRAYQFKEKNTRLHMICVLKGGHQFFSDLCNALKVLTLTGVKEPPLTFDFIRVKSYHNTESSGKVSIESIGVDLESLKGRHVLLVVRTGSAHGLHPHTHTLHVGARRGTVRNARAKHRAPTRDGS